MSRPYTYEYLNIHIIHIHIHIHIHARLTVPRSTHAQGTSQNTPAANLLVLWLLPTMVWYWYGSTKYQTPHHTTPHNQDNDDEILHHSHSWFVFSSILHHSHSWFVFSSILHHSRPTTKLDNINFYFYQDPSAPNENIFAILKNIESFYNTDGFVGSILSRISRISIQLRFGALRVQISIPVQMVDSLKTTIEFFSISALTFARIRIQEQPIEPQGYDHQLNPLLMVVSRLEESLFSVL
jgi:hypothetical protein